MAHAHPHTCIRTPTYQYPANTLKVLRERKCEKRARARERECASESGTATSERVRRVFHDKAVTVSRVCHDGTLAECRV